MSTLERLYLQWKISESHLRGVRREYLSTSKNFVSIDHDYEDFMRISDAYNRSRIVSFDTLSQWVDLTLKADPKLH